MARYLAGSLAALLAGTSLVASGQETGRPRPAARTFARGAWVEVRRIADEAGRLFIEPQLIAARNDTVFLYDGESKELMALTRSGRVLWRVGRAGKGPREFAGPVDLQFAPNGDLHVLDPALSRITVVSAAGRVSEMHTLEERLHRIVPQSEGWWGVALGRPELLVWIPRGARRAGARVVAAPSDVARLHPLVREPHVARLPNGGAVLAFVWASRLLLVDPRGSNVSELHAPEQVPFPQVRAYKIREFRDATAQRIDPKAFVAAHAITADDTTALVLFGGASRDRGKVLDRYDLRSRRYVESARLPNAAVALRLLGNQLIALELDPAPALVFYEWRPPQPRPR